ncbi:Crp/Fnr family transcriptional regulator [Flavobacterium polysaccharolyticum]|uniref:Crp/Fnr family transcriptional regulator n=1 Tax=Flavobacterium polysaccharolyticum TaxID=3133148 RepID=A0ABU9NS65_9FLAO|nr:Crp/Fnr family transcriptional regulator [uncultured Flavobacterium sp.]
MSLLLRNQLESIISLTDQEFEYILTHFTIKRVKKKSLLLQVGQQNVSKFFVIKGVLKSYYIDKNDKEHILQFAEPDWWITDYKAFFNETEATIYVESITDCELLSITKKDLEKLAKEFHKMEHFFRVKSNAGYVAAQERIITMLNLTVIERFEYFLKMYPNFIKKIPKYHIASYIGVSREMLSRMAKNVTNHTE